MDACPYCRQKNLDPRKMGSMKWCYTCKMFLFNRDIINEIEKPLYKKETFPEPDCESGYSWNFLKEILDEATFRKFHKWMNGQTMVLCDGRKFNHDTKEYEQTSCVENPHGVVVYSYDVHRFLGFLGKYHQQVWD